MIGDEIVASAAPVAPPASAPAPVHAGVVAPGHPVVALPPPAPGVPVMNPAQPPYPLPLPPGAEHALKPAKQDARRPTRKPGRPATYVFDKPDEQLTEKERKMKVSIEKRRLRQNRSYHRRKKLATTKKPSVATAAASAAAASNPSSLSAAAATSAAAASSAPTSMGDLSAAALSASAIVSDSASMHTTDPTQSSHSTVAGVNLNPFMSVGHAGAAVSASHITITHPALLANGITLPDATASSSTAAVSVPKLIAGFSQNPLELLASATADRTVPTPLSQSSADPHALNPVDSGKMSIDGECDLTSTGVQISTAGEPAANGETSSAMAVVPSIEDTLQFDATAPPAGESSFSFSLDGSKRAENEEEEEEATDLLVNNALVAAKEYARDSMNLKSVMDRETELRRMTGIKTIVFDNLRTKYVGMTVNMRDALRHFVIFPRTFNLNAAAAVGGFKDSELVTVQGMLESMIQTNFITTSKGRYELNDAARLFLNEDPSVLNENFANGTYDVAQKRFVTHYRKQLVQLQDDDIHKIGFLREKAMALFDSERENMEFSEYLLNGQHSALREFLSAGITVMRYCVGAANRERALQKALLETDEDVTSDNALLEMEANKNVKEVSSSSESDSTLIRADNSHRARLFLALSEAYFDQLKLTEAEQPLLEALKLMRDMNPRGTTTPSSSIVDSVLILLLLSNLRLSANRVKEARVLCVKALRILAEAGLGRSTFGINAMSNLVSIYLMEGHMDKAKSVASRLLDTLNTMSYTGMPIYADALGVCATVSMAEQNFKEAEKQFSRALETVGKWGSKEWSGIPVQHCLDLDLWLMEGLADAIRRQGKVMEASVLEERAAKDRESRGLPTKSLGSSQQGPSASDDSGGGPSLRHLY